MSSGSGEDDVASDLLGNLLPALVQTFALVFLGYVAARAAWMPRAAISGLGRFAASFSLPALCFLSIATLDLGEANPQFLVGMLAAKGSVAAAIFVFTAYLTPEESPTETRSWSLAALFAMTATSSNDFALGLPIVMALFTGKNGSVDGFSYLFLMAPIQLLVINPICFSVLELAAAVSRRREAAAMGLTSGGAINCQFIVRQVLLPTITNPVVFMVGMGVLANISGAGARLPTYVSGVLDTLGNSFSSLALFCLGASMSVAEEEHEEHEEEEDEQGDLDPDAFDDAPFLIRERIGNPHHNLISRDVPHMTDRTMMTATTPPELADRDRRDSIQSTASSVTMKAQAMRPSTPGVQKIMASHMVEDDYDEVTAGRWIQAALLVCAKSILLPVLSRFLVLQLTGDEDLSRFAFVYGTFPSSAQNLLFAERYGASESDCSLIALSTLMGTITFGPLVFASAEMITIDLRTADAGAATNILLLVEQVGWASVIGSLWVLGVAFSMIVSPQRYGSGWRRHHLVWSVFFLAACQAAYPMLSAICSDVSFRTRFPGSAAQCSLAIEGMVVASRIWGVIIIVSDIHRLHKEAATTSVLWKVVRVGKWGILWVAWLLPGVWLGTLWATGLWSRLDQTCWACFNSRGDDEMSKAEETYQVASSVLALCLALVAIVGLVWEQRQRRKPRISAASLFGVGPPDVPYTPSSAPASLEAPLLGPGGTGTSPTSDPALPMWSSLLLRTVGLCNLLGLLLQMAVGIGALLPALDGIMLEIIALNHFGLFAQGIATGLLLGTLPEAPTVIAVTRFGGVCSRLWKNCMDWYVDPRRRSWGSLHRRED